MPSRSIHIIADDKISFLLMAESYFIVSLLYPFIYNLNFYLTQPSDSVWENWFPWAFKENQGICIASSYLLFTVIVLTYAHKFLDTLP